MRHGAAVGLRAIVRTQGASIGAAVDAEPSVRRTQNRLFVEDLALRICCVLALDRFGDYASESVVAPVRETCCQVLGLLSRSMSRASVTQLIDAMARMQSRAQWHIRHASFLGQKYVLVARKDMLEDLQHVLLPVITAGLQDADDEVMAAAAETLTPICRCILPPITFSCLQRFVERAHFVAATRPPVHPLPAGPYMRCHQASRRCGM